MTYIESLGLAADALVRAVGLVGIAAVIGFVAVTIYQKLRRTKK